MQIANRKFAPGVWPTVATVVVIPIFVTLGFWQLDRADQKRTLHEKFLSNQSGEVIDLNNTNISTRKETDILWRRVIATGHFNENIQILLDNQVYDKTAGYFVYTPFKLENSDTWYLVNRGWVDAGTDRNDVPDISFNMEKTVISGVIKYPQVTGILLSENTPEVLKPGSNYQIYRMNKIEPDMASRLIKLPLQAYEIRLSPESDNGLIRQWQAPGSGEDVHLGYAFQWFALAVMVVVIYIVLNLKKSSPSRQ